MPLEGLTYLAPRDPWKFVQQQVEKCQNRPSIGWIPKALFINHIFKSSSPQELCRNALVCKNWRVFTLDESLWKDFNLTEIFPLLKIIGETVWKEHVNLEAFGLSFEDELVLHRRKEILNLNRLFASVNLEVKSITRLTMPKGLAFDNLEELAEFPKRGNPTCIRTIRPSDKTSVQETCVVYVANSILKGTRNLSQDAHEYIVEKVGCEMPDPLTMSTLIILTYMSSRKDFPTYLYGTAPWTFTRCKRNVMVGGFNSYGLAVFSADDFAGVDYGVTVMQKA
ncbi:MAG TPA: F-box protein [Rhabdochlamydiaceae bacterium]|nr:F-box protein [Rhabdochlamydiaceae bacterium]